MHVLGCHKSIFTCLVDLKKLIQCVSSIDLHMTYDADVSRRTSVGTCKYELAITGLLQNKCASFNYVSRMGFQGSKKYCTLQCAKTCFSDMFYKVLIVECLQTNTGYFKTKFEFNV